MVESSSVRRLAQVIADDLAQRWPLQHGHDVRDTLLAAYDETHRAYHDLRHLREVLDRVDELGYELSGDDTRVVVELAAWFHDAVYDVRAGAGENEEASAQLAERLLPGSGLAAEETRQVARLVRGTADHRADPDDVAAAVVYDADLAILAAEPSRYAEYARDVRREYAHVADDDFAAGRTQVLTDLLAAPTLYATPTGRAQWEDVARRNVSDEIARLRSR